jgi:hypothetical protein
LFGGVLRQQFTPCSICYVRGLDGSSKQPRTPFSQWQKVAFVGEKKTVGHDSVVLLTFVA